MLRFQFFSKNSAIYFLLFLTIIITYVTAFSEINSDFSDEVSLEESRKRKRPSFFGGHHSLFFWPHRGLYWLFIVKIKVIVIVFTVIATLTFFKMAIGVGLGKLLGFYTESTPSVYYSHPPPSSEIIYPSSSVHDHYHEGTYNYPPTPLSSNYGVPLSKYGPPSSQYGPPSIESLDSYDLDGSSSGKVNYYATKPSSQSGIVQKLRGKKS